MDTFTLLHCVRTQIKASPAHGKAGKSAGDAPIKISISQSAEEVKNFEIFPQRSGYAVHEFAKNGIVNIKENTADVLGLQKMGSRNGSVAAAAQGGASAPRVIQSGKDVKEF